MNNKGQVGDVLEFKIGTIAMIVVIIIALLIFNIPTYKEIIFGKENVEVGVSKDLRSFQVRSYYVSFLMDYLREKSSVGNKGDLISTKDKVKIMEELGDDLPYIVNIYYTGVDDIIIGEGEVRASVLLPEKNGGIIKIDLVLAQNE